MPTTPGAIALAIHEVGGLLASHIQDAKTSEEFETATDMVSSIITLSKMVRKMTLPQAVATVLSFENPEREMIIEALQQRGIAL